MLRRWSHEKSGVCIGIARAGDLASAGASEQLRLAVVGDRSASVSDQADAIWLKACGSALQALSRLSRRVRSGYLSLKVSPPSYS